MPISFITNQLYIKLTLKHVNFIVTRLKFRTRIHFHLFLLLKISNIKQND